MTVLSCGPDRWSLLRTSTLVFALHNRFAPEIVSSRYDNSDLLIDRNSSLLAMHFFSFEETLLILCKTSHRDFSL